MNIKEYIKCRKQQQNQQNQQNLPAGEKIKRLPKAKERDLAKALYRTHYYQPEMPESWEEINRVMPAEGLDIVF